ncbi:hypothetical protein [Haloarcula halophila]|uniref:hypothetical protein n=1 Tax=Haloarcula TaxID=2237 RepID=UPI0023E3D792|nr:hypothetical protein [Halomicroarcula sp. DFY41]
MTVPAGESRNVSFSVSIPNGVAPDTVESELTTTDANGNTEDTATVDTDVTAEDDTAFITGDLRDQNGNRIDNASDVELIVETDGDADGTISGDVREVEASPAFVSGSNDEYTVEVPVPDPGTFPDGIDYRVRIDTSQVENATGTQYESFARTALVEAGSTERFDVRLQRVVNADDIEIVASDGTAIADSTDEASFTAQVTTNDLASPDQPLEGEDVTVSFANPSDVDGTVDLDPDTAGTQTSVTTSTNADGEVTFTATSDTVQDVLLEFETSNGLTTQATASFIPEDGEGVFVAQVKDKDTAAELEGATVYAVETDRFLNNQIDANNETNVDTGDQALFRVINEDTGAVVDNDDYDITYDDSSDFVRNDTLNQSDDSVGSGFLATAGDGGNTALGPSFQFNIVPIEPGNYTVQSTETGDIDNPGNANFTNVSGAVDVEVTENLTAAGVEDRASNTDANPVATTNENGQATLTNLRADGKNGVDYTVMAERADYARQYQDATITSYDTDRDVVERTFLLEEKEVEPDSVNITQVGVHPAIDDLSDVSTDDITAFDDQSDDTYQPVARDGTIDVIEVNATATNFQGEVVDDLDTNVTVGLNDDFDGQFLPTAIGGTVVNVDNSSSSPTVTVSTDGDSEATVLLETVQNDTTLRTNKTATLEADSSITDESNVTFVGTTVFETGSVSGIVTNEDNEPIIGSVVYTEEFVSQNGTVFTIEAEDDLTDRTRSEVLDAEFTVTNTDSGENVTVTGETLQAYEIANGTGNGFDTVTLQNATSVTLLTFPSEQQGQAQYTLPRVPAQDPDGVDYTRVAGIELDSGTEGVGDTDSPVKIDFTQEANVVIVGAEPTDGNFEVSGLSAPTTVGAEEEFTASATIENTAPVSDTKTVEFRVGTGLLTENTTVASQEVTLEAGESQTVEFDGLSLANTGNYTHGVFTDDGSQTAEITVTNDTSSGGVERFDTNNNGEIDFPEVIAAIQASNDDSQIGGQPVGFQDVLAVIEAYNQAN